MREVQELPEPAERPTGVDLERVWEERRARFSAGFPGLVADVRVREALSISINREVIGPDVLGTGELPAYGWVPPGTSNYEGETYMPDWASEDYGARIERAQALMEEAGFGRSHQQCGFGWIPDGSPFFSLPDQPGIIT